MARKKITTKSSQLANGKPKKGAPFKNVDGIANGDRIDNGFGSAIGFGQQFPFSGQFGFPGGPTMQPVESTTPLYTNMRWYLVSNMRQVLSQIYVELGLVQTIVNVPIDDGLRGGIMLKSKQLSEDEIKKLQISIDRDDDLNTAGWAAKWNRLYGGAGIMILVGDQDPESEFDINSIGPDTELEFRAVDMWELFWDKQNTEGYDPEIQAQDFEFYSYYSKKIHKSRVMRLKSIMAPSFIRPRLRGWGVSVVESLVRSLNQYLKAIDLGYEVLDEFKIDVYRLKGLVNTLLSPTGEASTRKRIAQMNFQKNYQNAIVMDKEDEYDHKQLSFAGLAETMAGIRMQVAADMRMPITKLFGTSVSSGFQTDQNDMENYNSMVESEVRNKLKYDLLRMCEIKCQKLFGYIPDDLELEFKPLRELSAVDQETVKTQKFARLLQTRDAGIINDEQFADAANKGNLFDIQLENAADGLNPNNPDVADETSPSREPDKDLDIDDPGANRADTRKTEAGNGFGAGKEPVNKKKKEKEPK